MGSMNLVPPLEYSKTVHNPIHAKVLEELYQIPGKKVEATLGACYKDVQNTPSTFFVLVITAEFLQ